MAKTLDVYLFKDLVGHLIQDDGGQMAFDYAENWIEKTDAYPLSRSLPLRKERFSRKECRGFFAGILPEESKREIIARNLGISARNDYAMLERMAANAQVPLHLFLLASPCQSTTTATAHLPMRNWWQS